MLNFILSLTPQAFYSLLLLSLFATLCLGVWGLCIYSYFVKNRKRKPSRWFTQYKASKARRARHLDYYC